MFLAICSVVCDVYYKEKLEKKSFDGLRNELNFVEKLCFLVFVNDAAGGRARGIKNVTVLALVTKRKKRKRKRKRGKEAGVGIEKRRR